MANINILILPGVALLILGFVSQLSDIAQSSSDKVLNYADDMNLAMDCAVMGVPISQCSPNLMKVDFSKEVDNVTNLLNEMDEINVSIDINESGS